MDFGHTDPKFLVPYGIEGQIDCDARQITFLESPTALEDALKPGS
jgi:muramoyltetrapeptide carboxypeptidase LdcA involved in peptidoglycan recycling